MSSFIYTYKTAGVDIEAGENAVRQIAPMVRSTHSPQVIRCLGGYAGLFALSTRRGNVPREGRTPRRAGCPINIKEPVLVASTDGVGTKLLIASLMNRHDTIGIDLVAMSVNDIIVSGATPLFFLDYFATGLLSPPKMVEVVKGIVKGCRQAGCALLGGETAEMPSFYQNGQYDLAGFAVGIVEKKKIIDGKKIRPGDLLIGLASSGLHSNGYALARKIVFEKMGKTVHDRIAGSKKSIGEILLTPTLIYANCFLNLTRQILIKGAAHITGGGMTRNIPRILPQNCAAKVYRDRFVVPAIFKIIEKEGGVEWQEMYKTFNMGIGLVLVIDAKKADQAVSTLKDSGQRAFIIGEVVRGREGGRPLRGVIYE